MDAFTRGSRCVYCLNRKVLAGFNDLATTHPELAAQWDFDKNAPLTPDQVIAGSSAVRHWICSNGHSFSISGNQRLFGYKGKGRGCGICSGRNIAPGLNDLQASGHPILQEWHPEKNKPLLPSQITPKSTKRIWWLCQGCGHEWEASPNSRNKGENWTKCPNCTGRIHVRPPQKLIRGVNDLATKHPQLVAEWDWDKNQDIDPVNLLEGANFNAHWICAKGHNFRQMVNSRTLRNYGCPFCSGQKVLTGFNDLATLGPDLCLEWNYALNPKHDPTTISVGSKARIWWRCSLGHDYPATIANRFYLRRGCPYCGHRNILIGFNDLLSQHPDIAQEWDFEKNFLLPSEIMSGSNRKVFWVCAEGHGYRSTPNARTGSFRTGCGKCNRAGGFHGKNPGLLYFLEHREMLSFKVGITSLESGRLSAFQRNNWIIHATWESADGYEIRDLESRVLRWVRKELQLPEFLDSQSMNNSGGHTETFSSELVSVPLVLEQIDSFSSEFSTIRRRLETSSD
jgi:hypothetical protein